MMGVIIRDHDTEREGRVECHICPNPALAVLEFTSYDVVGRHRRPTASALSVRLCARHYADLQAEAGEY